jgi:hypothetical protein
LIDRHEIMGGMKSDTPEKKRANWFALCDMAEVAPDTRKTAQELTDRLRARGLALWPVRDIQRCMDEYEETLT